MKNVRTIVAAVALAATGVLGVGTVGATERVSTLSHGALKAACAANGGSFHGTASAYGCTKDHPDGSTDSYECGSRSGCVHVHFDARRIMSGSTGGTGRSVTAAR
jgi:hypothetical protein